MREYLPEASGFASGYIWTLLVFSLGVHLTFQRTVCSMEYFPGGFFQIEACNGYLTVLQQVIGTTIVHIAAALTGVLLASATHVLKDQ